MSDQRTTIHSPRGGIGYSDHGRKTRVEMIELYRGFAQRQLAEARAVLETPDDEFEVYQHTGLYVQRNRVDLPAGSR